MSALLYREGEALLLHGETHPVDEPSSQSNQRVFDPSEHRGSLKMAVGKAFAVSGQIPIHAESLPAMPALVLANAK